MQLFIKTPLYEHNKYVPHLLEHCVLFSSEREEAFTYFGDINAGTTYGGTEFEFYSPLSLSHLLKKISQPISQETFRIQKKYLAYELKNPIFSQKLREKFMQTVENNSCIRANTLQKGVNLELLTNYQKKWYQEQQMIFVGEDNNVDLQFGKGKSLKKLNGKWDKKCFSVKHLMYQKRTYSLFVCNYRTASDILVLDFLEGLISHRIFRKSLQQQQPFEDILDITLSDQYMFLSAIEMQPFKDIDADFYSFYQQRYLAGLAFNRWRGLIPRIALYTGEYVSKKEHQQFIQQLTYEGIQSLLALFSR